jgi:hypothetical protein
VCAAGTMYCAPTIAQGKTARSAGQVTAVVERSSDTETHRENGHKAVSRILLKKKAEKQRVSGTRALLPIDLPAGST